jgi:hypothetical protein
VQNRHAGGSPVQNVSRNERPESRVEASLNAG